MRPEDREEAECLGVSAQRMLWRSFRNSFWRRAHFIDGELAAISAVGGTLLGNVGNPWIITSPIIERAPVAYFREARREVDALLEIFPRLESLIGVKHKKALRFFSMLGFTIIPGEPGALFHVVVKERERYQQHPEVSRRTS
jgi:hypothetical protein